MSTENLFEGAGNPANDIFNVTDHDLDQMEDDGGEIIFDDDDDSSVSDNYDNPNNFDNQEDEDPNNSDGTEDNNPNNPSDDTPAVKLDENGNIIFEDEEEEEEEEDDEAKLIEKLKAKGFEVKSPENRSKEGQQQKEISRLSTIIKNADSFLSLPDEAVIRQKERNDLALEYEKNGRKEYVGSEEFNMDLEERIDEITSSKTTMKVYADSIRRDVQTWKKNNENKKNSLIESIEKDRLNTITENRNRIKNELNNISNKGFLDSFKISPEVLKETYKFVTDGSLSQELEKNPELVGEFGLFLKIKDQLKDALSKPTYGEGIKAVFEGLSGNSSQSPKNPLHTTKSSGNQVSDFVKNRFGGDSKKEENKPYVAGRGVF